MRDSLGIIHTRHRHIWSIPDGDKARLKRMRLPGWGIVCLFLGTLLVAALFDHVGRLELTLPSLASVAAICLVVVVKWRLRAHAWFWMTVAFFVATHILLLVLVPWTKRWVPAATSAGIGTIDIYAMLAIISVIGNLRGSDI